MKDDIGGVFDLHEDPVITAPEITHEGTKTLSPAIEATMPLFGVECGTNNAAGPSVFSCNQFDAAITGVRI